MLLQANISLAWSNVLDVRLACLPSEVAQLLTEERAHVNDDDKPSHMQPANGATSIWPPLYMTTPSPMCPT